MQLNRPHPPAHAGTFSRQREKGEHASDLQQLLRIAGQQLHLVLS